MKKPNLVSIFKNFKNKPQSTPELNFLIKISYRISLSIIKTRFSSRLSKNVELSFEDLAIDSIVPLFVKNKAGEYGIKIAIDNWDDSLELELDIEFFLSKIIFKRVEQTITKYIKEKDPVFEKIHKTLSVCITSNKFVRHRFLGTLYILEKGIEKISAPLISEVDFDSIPSELFNYKQKELFEKLFEYIKTETNYFPALPLNQIVNRVKANYFEDYKTVFAKNGTIDSSFIENDILNESLHSLEEKMETFYIKKNIVTSSDAEKIMMSFNDISSDIKNGGMTSSLFSYLKFRKQSLSQEEFYSNYHHVMNYLLKHFKTNISQLIS